MSILFNRSVWFHCRLPIRRSSACSSITTPKRLAYFRLKQSLGVLLTPAERRQPLILYLTPGLLISQILQIVSSLMLHYIRAVVVFAIAPNNSGVHALYASPIRLVIGLVFALIATALLAPLEVITIRLAIQRNRSSPMRGSVMLAEAPDAYPDSGNEVPDFSAEDVIA